MANYINSLNYSGHSWILVAKDTGQPMVRGEGVRLFDSYEDAQAARTISNVNGYAYTPVPLIK